MAEFKLGRLRFIWKGLWTTSTTYVKDDIVRFGGKSYVCLVGHIAHANFYTDLNATTPLWALMTDGVSWAGTWATSTEYKIGDIVQKGASSYICSTGHTSSSTANSGFYSDKALNYWTSLSSGIEWSGSWVTSTFYNVGDIVKIGASSYICSTSHTSSSTANSGFYSDKALNYWTLISSGIEWSGSWVISTFYNIGDIVKVGAKTYICILSHTSSSTANSGFYSDLIGSKWTLLNDGQQWIGSWNISTFYKIGDIIKYGSNVYICTTAHTSSSTLAGGFYSDLDLNNWSSMVSGHTWLGNWSTSTYYKINDIVKFGAKDYICTTAHTSNSTADSGFYLDSANWQLLTDGIQWVGLWTASTYYKISDIVTYGGNTYICSTGHTSQSTLEADNNKWTIFVKGINFIGNWSGSSVAYKINDVVKYGADVWICTTAHTSSSTFSTTNFTLFVQGLEYVNTWDSITSYAIGDIATYGGYTYSSLTTNNINNTPSTSPSSWSPVTTGFKMMGAWSSSTSYLVGHVVSYGGYTYVAAVDNTNQNPPTNPSSWTLLNSGLSNRGTWSAAQSYRPGDIVSYVSSSYICVLSHTSATGNRPDNDLIGTYWNVLVQGSANSFNTTTGDITYRSGTGSDTRLGIGSDGQVLRVTNGLPSWQTYGVINNVYYVSLTGTDSDGYGVSLDKPWRTINYACQQVMNGMNNPNARFLLTQNKNWLVAEMYYWMLYQKANNNSPFTTSSVFDATKTQRDAKYIVDAVIYDLTRGGNSQSVSTTLSYFAPGSTNTFVNATVTSEMPYFIAAINKLLALMGNAIGNSAPAQNYQTLMSAPSPVSQVINLSYTAESGTSSTITTLVGIITTALSAVSTSSVPLPNQGETATIFIKNGTYTETLPISIPPNVAIVGDELRGTIVEPSAGYSSSNMFYVRNGSGIRNMTLTGLTGSFTAVNSYGTKRVTGGSFVSLDPGANANDTSVWILQRSPYVQNVTTLGTGCVGMKIDGSLHNGGNKSIVANDFTQVINDGIGIWCTGTGAKTELVSVFTYYNYIGYLSEAGGKIRATNGNNSYGTLGSVSETYDTTETAITSTVTNQANQATVTNILTNGNNILWLEYSNAGQAYSTAIYSITSATGFNAAVSSPTIYSNGVCEVRITSGGSGYISATNSAQAGDATTITLSAADTSISGQYIGMRIIITAGTGAGQYGYIQSYNPGTKVATIYKESTSTAGWDVAVSGTTVSSVLDSTTSYTIEPRITFTGSGTGALARASVYAGAISAIRIINPGSGYISAPTMNIIDPNSTNTGTYTVRTQTGVLGQPTWSNRGTGYTAAQASITGNGIAEFLQTGYYLTVNNLTGIPLSGASIAIAGNSNYYSVVLVSSQSGSSGNYTATFQINPSLGVSNAPVQGTAVTFRSLYSQVRLTGHDFLSIGTGNIVSTNYPGVPLTPASSVAQVTQNGGGRVFYTSTDQDGNFNVGNLFNVQQATGIATLNASSFNLSGLYSLQLSGSGATITQFSADGTFTANSDALVPTQKAIRTYIASQLGAGGANLSVTSLTAGNVVASANTITTINNVDLNIQAISGNTVQFPGPVNFGSTVVFSSAARTTFNASSVTTFNSGSTLISNGTTILNGRTTQNTTPTLPTDVPNKKYVDRVLTLNNLWTSAW